MSSLQADRSERGGSLRNPRPADGIAQGSLRRDGVIDTQPDRRADGSGYLHSSLDWDRSDGCGECRRNAELQRKPGRTRIGDYVLCHRRRPDESTWHRRRHCRQDPASAGRVSIVNYRRSPGASNLRRWSSWLSSGVDADQREVIPSTIPPNVATQVVLTIGSASSQPGTTIALH